MASAEDLGATIVAQILRDGKSSALIGGKGSTGADRRGAGARRNGRPAWLTVPECALILPETGRTGRISASGSIWGIPVPSILPGAPTLPGNEDRGRDDEPVTFEKAADGILLAPQTGPTPSSPDRRNGNPSGKAVLAECHKRPVSPVHRLVVQAVYSL